MRILGPGHSLQMHEKKRSSLSHPPASITLCPVAADLWKLQHHRSQCLEITALTFPLPLTSKLSTSIAVLLLFYLQILQINPLSLHMIGPQHEREDEEKLPATGQLTVKSTEGPFYSGVL